jgi:hypothetical protein
LPKFNLATDKTLFVSGVLVTLKAGEYETKDDDLAERLRKAKGVEEVKTRKTKAAE